MERSGGEEMRFVEQIASGRWRAAHRESLLRRLDGHLACGVVAEDVGDDSQRALLLEVGRLGLKPAPCREKADIGSTGNQRT